MTTPPAHWPAIKALFESTAELPAAERAPLITAAALDADAHAELLSLLQHHDLAGNGPAFLAEPAAQALAGGAARIGQRLGAWEVVRAIGSGGMGEVFEARRADGQYDGRAAVKLLKRGMDSAAVLQRFAQERQALARLTHPHIARLLDAGASDDGLPYFVLEFVDGRPIDEAVRGLALERRLRLFLQLADAVVHAHRNLLVHRDLKPGNVLVDADGNVKLLDFGIAKALDPLEGRPGNGHGDTTVAGQRPYTPNYASPEQVRGEPVSTATDIYSLGVLLYQLLTGTRPTGRHATTPAEAARSVLEEAPTRPSRLSASEAVDPQWLTTRKRLEGDLDNILLKALEKSPERRYGSVEALAADVQSYLEGRTVSARTPSAAYVFRKFVLRNRWAVAAGALGTLGSAMGLGVALLQERHAAALAVVGLTGGLALALLQGRQAALSRDLAQTRLVQTRAIVADVMNRHADAVHYLPGGADLKVELLNNMIGHLHTLSQQAKDGPSFAGDLAVAYSRLAHLQGENDLLAMGGQADADANARRALSLFEAGEAEHAGDWRYHLWWARAWRSRAKAALQRSDLMQAKSDFEEMVRMVERGLKHHPHHPWALAELGSAHLGLGQLLCTVGAPNLGQPEAALKQLALAQAIYQELTQVPKPDPDDQFQLGSIAGAQALVCSSLGQDRLAVEHQFRSLASRRVSLAQNPEHVAYQTGLAVTSNNLASMHLNLLDPIAALPCAQASHTMLLTQEAADPASGAWREKRILFQIHLARAMVGAGQFAAALPLLQEICEAHGIKASPALVRRQAWAGLSLTAAHLGLGERAAAHSAGLRALASWNAVLAAAPGDIDGWLLQARTQRLLHGLVDEPGQAALRLAFDGSVAQARQSGPLHARRERDAQWDGAPDPGY
jgi:eukaryotic-like serine/threonine-protein kinase